MMQLFKDAGGFYYIGVLVPAVEVVKEQDSYVIQYDVPGGKIRLGSSTLAGVLAMHEKIQAAQSSAQKPAAAPVHREGDRNHPEYQYGCRDMKSRIVAFLLNHNLSSSAQMIADMDLSK